MGKGIAAHLCCSFYVHSTMKLDNGLKATLVSTKKIKTAQGGLYFFGGGDP